MDNLRKFHITDFPHDRMFILLKKEFHPQIFTFLNQYSFKDFNTKFFRSELNFHTFKQWKSRKHFLPLWFLIEIHRLFEGKFPLDVIENNIEAYKGPSVSSIITSPNLPLIEDGRLLKIVAHALGDGSISGAFGTKLPKGKSHSEYRNFSSHLLDQFKQDLAVFGEVPTTIDYQHGHVIFPNSVGYILRHLYKVEFDTFNSRVPEVLYSLKKEVTSSFLRAFADDEGHVFDSSIEIYSANRTLIKDLIRLISLTFPEIELSDMKINYSSSKNPKYSFSFLSQSLPYYYQFIGFDHPQKQEDLLFAIARAEQWKQCRKTKNTPTLILKALENNSKTAKEISKELFVRHSYILKRLRELEQQGLIIKTDKTLHQAWIWSKR